MRRRATRSASASPPFLTARRRRFFAAWHPQRDRKLPQELSDGVEHAFVWSREHPEKAVPGEFFLERLYGLGAGLPLLPDAAFQRRGPRKIPQAHARCVGGGARGRGCPGRANACSAYRPVWKMCSPTSTWPTSRRGRFLILLQTDGSPAGIKPVGEFLRASQSPRGLRRPRAQVGKCADIPGVAADPAAHVRGQGEVKIPRLGVVFQKRGEVGFSHFDHLSNSLPGGQGGLRGKMSLRSRSRGKMPLGIAMDRQNRYNICKRILTCLLSSAKITTPAVNTPSRRPLL